MFENFVKESAPILSGKAWLTVLEISRYAGLDDFRKSYLEPKLDNEYNLSDMTLKALDETLEKMKLNQL